jgi:threonylcarbamoyladenosine tRNA methylthiotransferase MtaB
MKVYFDMVGCRLNQAEIERMAAQFRVAGHEIVDSPHHADLVVINSCSVTAAAASDSRQKVRQANRAGAGQIVLTGCWATMSPQAARELAGVTQVFPNEEKESIPQLLMGAEDLLLDLEPLERKPLPGAHRRTRAFIKAQDGCDNLCTFCITRLARGSSHSLPRECILEEVRHAVAGGTHEVVLTGVNLGSWGKDSDGKADLAGLVRYLLANSGVERLRLSSIEPWDMDENFLSLWEDKRLCRHLHIPLQSGCAETLKRMGRRITPEKYRSVIQQVRERIPEVAVTTDIIVGFAGESEDEFIESLDFVREMDFAGGHVFRYSPREGTPAWHLPGRVSGLTAHARSDKMRQILGDSELAYRQRFVGQEMDVLWESSKQMKNGRWQLHGLTGNYLSVSAEAAQDSWNRFDTVRLLKVLADSIAGTIIKQELSIQ